MIQKDFKFHLRMTVPTLIVLVLAAGWRIKLGDLEPTSKVERCLEIMGRTGLSAPDEAELTAGYYEGLLDGAQETARKRRGLLRNLSTMQMAPPDWVNLANTDGVRRHNAYLRYDIKPNIDIPLKGDRLKTNRWGHRDRDYEKSRPDGARRLVLVGSSIALGEGVPVERIFKSLLEEKLNAEPPCENAARIEILNFSVSGYITTEQLEVAVELAPQFEPDAVIVVLNYLAFGREWANHLGTLVQHNHDLKYDFLREFAQKAGLRSTDTRSRIITKMNPYQRDLIEACIREIKRRLDEKGIETVILVIPHTAQREFLRRNTSEMLERLSDLNLPVVDAADAFGTRTLEALRLREWDNHPNELGHRLIFEALDERIRTDPRLRNVIGGCAEEVEHEID